MVHVGRYSMCYVHSNLISPQAIPVEGGEAVDNDGDGEDEGEDAEDGAHGPHQLARLRLGPSLA